MSTCGGQFLKDGSRKRRNIKKRTCLKNGRREQKKNKSQRRKNTREEPVLVWVRSRWRPTMTIRVVVYNQPMR
jgi:hypothetical protein